MLENLEAIIEAILFAANEPVSIERLQQLLGSSAVEAIEGEGDEQKLPAKTVRAALETLNERYRDRSIELVEVASGFRFQVKREYTPWLQKLQARKSARYSRAFLETLALVIYRQPITRGEIEEVRGVAVSTQIMKLLLELEWIRIVGQKDVPGKPALYGSTKKFLDDFNLKSLTELPVLQEPKNLEKLEQQLAHQLQAEMEPVADTAMIV